MTIPVSQLMHSKVISLKEGKELEDVDDVVYDPNKQKIIALVLNPGKLYSTRIVPFEKVKKIGEGIVFIDSQEDIKRATDILKPIDANAPEEEFLNTTPIVLENGEYIGNTVDVIFDKKSGKVKELGVATNIKNSPKSEFNIKVEDIKKVDNDKTVVKDKNYMQENELKSQDQIANLVHDIKQTIKDPLGVFK